MIISKAIEILNLGLPADTWKLEPDLKNSIKLGIEALKRIQECRQHPFAKTVSPLIGETIPDRGIHAAFQETTKTPDK